MVSAELSSNFAELEPLTQDAISGPGTLRDRLVRFVRSFVQMGLDDVDSMRLALTATSPSFEKRPEIDLISFHNEYFGPLGRLVAEGVTTGDFRPDVDPEFAVSALLGPMTMHLRGAIEGKELPDDYAEQAIDLGQQQPERAAIPQHLDEPARFGRTHGAGNLGPDPLGNEVPDLARCADLTHQVQCPGMHPKAQRSEAGRESRHPQHPQRVFPESRANMAQAAVLEVPLPAERVDQATLAIARHRIDREVAS